MKFVARTVSWAVATICKPLEHQKNVFPNAVVNIPPTPAACAQLVAPQRFFANLSVDIYPSFSFLMCFCKLPIGVKEESESAMAGALAEDAVQEVRPASTLGLESVRSLVLSSFVNDAQTLPMVHMHANSQTW